MKTFMTLLAGIVSLSLALLIGFIITNQAETEMTAEFNEDNSPVAPI
jgi:uncharacterized protein YneF (UPF0154 family)